MPYKDKKDAAVWIKKRRAENQAWVNKLKLERGCADCGYNEHPAGLEFDHVNPIVRGRVAAPLSTRSKEIIMEETDACEVVCGTCHNIRTYERRNKRFEK